MIHDPRFNVESLPAPTVVPGVTDLVDLQLGIAFGCGLNRQAQVRCWGMNTRYGQLGYGSGTEEWVPPPGRVVELPPVREIAVSAANVCALTMNDEVYCWGQVRGGALGVEGVGATPPSPVRVVFPE